VLKNHNVSAATKALGTTRVSDLTVVSQSLSIGSSKVRAFVSKDVVLFYKSITRHYLYFRFRLDSLHGFHRCGNN